MGKQDIVFDPLDTQIQALDKLLREKELSFDSLAKNPETIQLLLQQQSIQLLEHKSLKYELSQFRNESESLKKERENLRIEVAVFKERENGTLLEIPISIVSGFAINLLSVNTSNGTGWLLLILSLILLMFIRKSQIDKLSKQFKFGSKSYETKN